ncbi:MAG: nitrate reductase molybdenum cofactor assembly chaperone [Streptosporangiaceae bacterium]
MTGEPFKLASVLLQYPTAAVLADVQGPDGGDLGGGVLAAEAARLPRSSAVPLGRFLGWLGSTPSADLARHYVETFDLRRRCSLYLTYYRYGDTRKRGMAMLGYLAAYRAAGFEPASGPGGAGSAAGGTAGTMTAGGELPDYLPLVLDFAALHPQGVRLLRAHRADLELLLRALRDVRSPYADVVEAVGARLPGLRRSDQALVRRFWQSGPPTEEVGQEPFAPPEYLAGLGGDVSPAEMSLEASR